MSQGHRWCGGAGQTQNQGNVLGDRPCVRQSKLYREHVGGNAMKEMFGQDSLKWSTTQQQGVYAGKAVWNGNERAAHAQPPQQQKQMQQQQQPQVQVQQRQVLQQTVQQQTAVQQQQQNFQQPQKNAVYDGKPTNVRCTGRSNQQSYNIFSQQ